MRTYDAGHMDLSASGGKQAETCLEMIATSATGVPVFDNLSNVRFTLTGGKRSWEGWVDKGVDVEKSEVENAGSGKSGSSNASSRSRTPSAERKATQPTAQQQPTSPAGAKAAGAKAQDNRSRPTYDMDWLAQDSIIDTWEEMQQRELHANLRATPAMKQAEREAVQAAALKARYSQAKESMSVANSNMTAAEVAWQSVRKQYLWVDGQEGPFESLFTPYESEGIYTCAACQPEL